MDLHLGHKSRAGVGRIRHPNGILSSPLALRDHVPPLITVSALPHEVVQDATATLLFTAVDAGSGMGMLAATFNGTPVASGDILIFSQLGKNVLKIQAVDIAGNPRVKEIDVDVRQAQVSSQLNGGTSNVVVL